ncbi:hypothetical protein [Cupriavidus consociatus]|uniref:hypothetical protein n=1 Tax=Cupriavidus consociatus TaxID=2821357 RepID=UPI001FD81465|nr:MULTISPECIES: hypothetical protein [unclassified Cupriavidus]MDK2660789.1 hypothetical protein [Cupriavidus sp. LEh21]
MENTNRWLEKTDAGRLEVASRKGGLDRRTRSLLIMVDGRIGYEKLGVLANQLGLEPAAIERLLLSGLIRKAGPSTDSQALTVVQSAALSSPSKSPVRKRSLAAAKFYLMDIAVRTFGTIDHPIRKQLIAATDVSSVQMAFDKLLENLRTTATPTLIEQIEASFRDQLPEG